MNCVLKNPYNKLKLINNSSIVNIEARGSARVQKKGPSSLVIFPRAFQEARQRSPPSSIDSVVQWCLGGAARVVVLMPEMSIERHSENYCGKSDDLYAPKAQPTCLFLILFCLL